MKLVDLEKQSYTSSRPGSPCGVVKDQNVLVKSDRLGFLVPDIFSVQVFLFS